MWSTDARFCLLCGTGLVTALIEGRPRKRCARCAFVLFENPASAAAGVVIDEQRRVLLVRRAIEPFLGWWALPAGYQEADEQPEETARREVLEETGIAVHVEGLLDLVFMPRDARKPANVAFFLCRPTGGLLLPGHDANAAAWFPLAELPTDLGFDNGPLVLERMAPGGDLERHLGGPWRR